MRDSTIGFLTHAEVLPKGSIYFKISPNPVREKYKLEMELNTREAVTFILEDLHGNEVMTKELNGDVIEQELDVQGLLSGV